MCKWSCSCDRSGVLTNAWRNAQLRGLITESLGALWGVSRLNQYTPRVSSPAFQILLVIRVGEKDLTMIDCDVRTDANIGEGNKDTCRLIQR